MTIPFDPSSLGAYSEPANDPSPRTKIAQASEEGISLKPTNQSPYNRRKKQ